MATLFKRILPVVVSAVLLLLLLWKLDAREVLAAVSGASWIWISLSLLIAATFPVLGTLRWLAVIRPMGAEIGFGAACRVTMGAFPLNSFLPSKAGDLSKAAFLRAHGGLIPLAGSVVFERMVDVIVLTGMTVVGALFLGQKTVLCLALGCAILTVGAITVLSLSGRLPLPQRIQDKASDIGKAARAVFRFPKYLVLVLFWSGLNWLGTMAESYCLLRAVYIDVPFITVLAVMPLAIFVGLLPLTISGIGTRDAALVWLLATMASAEKALAAGILYTAVSYWFLGLLGLPFLFLSMYSSIGGKEYMNSMGKSEKAQN